jgi:hypothetical protein
MVVLVTQLKVFQRGCGAFGDICSVSKSTEREGGDSMLNFVTPMNENNGL